MFRHELLDDATEKKHMTSLQAANCAKTAGVGKMGLIHYSPRYMEYDLRQMLKEAREVFDKTFLTRDGQYLSIPNID